MFRAERTKWCFILAGALANAACTGQDDEVSPYWGAMGIYVTVYSHEEARELGADRWREAFLLETRQEDDGSVRFLGEWSTNYLTDNEHSVANYHPSEGDSALEVLYNRNLSHAVYRYCLGAATTEHGFWDEESGNRMTPSVLYSTDQQQELDALSAFAPWYTTTYRRSYWLSANPSVALVPFIDTWDPESGEPVERLLRVDAPLVRGSGATCAALQVVRAWMRAATPESLAPVGGPEADDRR